MPWPNKPDKGKARVNDTRCDVALLPDFNTEQLAQQQLATMGDQERLRKKSALANRRRDWPITGYENEMKWLYVSLSKGHFDWCGFCECARPNSDLYWSLLPWPNKPGKAWNSGREKAERPMIFGEEVIEVKIDSLIEAIKAVDVNPGTPERLLAMGDDCAERPPGEIQIEWTRCDVPLLPDFDTEQQAQKRVAAMGEKERLQRKFSLTRDGKSRYWNSQYLSLSKLHFDWQGFSECARPESDLCWYLLPWPDTQGTTISCEETVKTDPLIHVIRVFEVKPSSAPTSHESTLSMRPTKVTVAPRIFGRRGERSEKKSARNKPDAPQQSDAPVWPRGMASTNIPKVRPRFIRQKSFEGATAGQSAIIKPKTLQQSEMPSSATVNDELAVASSRTSSSPPLTLPVIIPPGGDPFALLKSCEGARRKLAPGTVNQLFTQLRMRYNQFNTEQQMRLAKQMIDLFPEHKVTECTLCDITVTPSRVINHICHETHVNAMNGVVCADAFNFLLNAVRTFSFDDSLEERTIVKSETIQQSDMASSNLPMISPPPGVDPFALLKSCEGANRKSTSHFSVMGKRCAFCDTLPGNASDLIVHICSDTHIEAMNGAVCKDAFDFWWNTVVTNKDLYSKQSEVVEKVDDQPVEKKVLPDNKIPICSKSSTQSIAIAQIFPPTGVDPFALIKSCEGAKRKMVDNVKMQFKFLKARMRAGNVKLLEHATSTLFEKGHVCALCGPWLFSAPEMINHIATTMHIEKMNGLVCADAFDFWWNAVVVKQPEIPTCSKSSTRKVYRQSITYPQISPPPGVDPFALLKSCEGAERKMVDDIAIQFDLLNARMREGNINRLDQKTSKLFEKGQECAFCGTKMNGSVCADAFDFWWNSCGN
ncbi:hypothetical protein PRIPAC_90010 [Pristionchus pacificus]|uniref:Uncharacterized protein n=1 Tax=Pristionchus pacificus TaxID=54126 RepID=A0A2A6CXB7_PRIPA|nr:hypothetical protein PRIPAC_90010 [Pristionchus pacificus]|eukprot:PDM82778.1 hypothetical protein PRIPAC_37171 [Pristionchus pacificus]